MGWCVLQFIYVFITAWGSRYRKEIRQQQKQQKQTCQTKEITACPYPFHSVVQGKVKSCGNTPLRGITVSVTFCVRLHGPSRVPGISPLSSPIPPLLSHSISVRCFSLLSTLRLCLLRYLSARPSWSPQGLFFTSLYVGVW